MLKAEIKSEVRKIDKIYRCIQSCNTIEQYNSAFSMLLRYSIKRPNNPGIILMLSYVQDYAITKYRYLKI